VKIEEFVKGPIVLSAYVEMGKKISNFLFFCLYPPAQMIENQRVFSCFYGSTELAEVFTGGCFSMPPYSPLCA
jgi:hypothetical protein